MWDLNVRKQGRHLQTTRQKPKRQNNFTSNLFWQPLKLQTLADCLLVVTEATSSAATGISTLLSASWGWAQGVSSCTTFLCGAEGLKNRATNPHRCPRREFSHAYLFRKWTGIFYLPALALSTLTPPFSSREEGSAQGFSTAADDSCWKSPFEPDLSSFPKFILTHRFLL